MRSLMRPPIEAGRLRPLSRGGGRGARAWAVRPKVARIATSERTAPNLCGSQQPQRQVEDGHDEAVAVVDGLAPQRCRGGRGGAQLADHLAVIELQLGVEFAGDALHL